MGDTKRVNAAKTKSPAGNQPAGPLIQPSELTDSTIMSKQQDSDTANNTAIAEPPAIHICINENATDAIRSFGLVATTHIVGSKTIPQMDWSPLQRKRVVIVPESGNAGRTHAAEIANLIHDRVPTAEVRVAHLSDSWSEIPDQCDAADWSKHFDGQPCEYFRTELERISKPFEFVPNVSDCDMRPTDQTRITDTGDQFRPFPVEALPSPVQSYCKTVCDSIGCDQSYFAVPVLAAMAGVIGNAREIQIKKGHREPSILWTVVIAESGSAKSPPQKAIKAPLQKIQSECFVEFNQQRKQFEIDNRQWRRDVKQWEKRLKDQKSPMGTEPTEPEKPVCVQHIVKTTTTEAIAPLLSDNQRGLLVARDELSGWLNGLGVYGNSTKAQADAAAWLEWYDAEPSLINTKNGDAPCIHVPRPQVSVMGTIQPATYSKAMAGDNSENGLQARLLPCFPPYTQPGWIEAEVSPRASDAWEHFIRELYQLKPNRNELDGAEHPSIVALSPAAKRRAKDFAETHAEEQEAMAGGLLKSFWSKLRAACFRIALILHCADQVSVGVSDPWQVSEDVMNRAIQIVEWWKAETVRVHRLLSEDEATRSNRQLVDWIRRNHSGRITAAKLRTFRRDIKSTPEAEVLLIRLVEAGFGTWRSIHKSREFVLNP